MPTRLALLLAVIAGALAAPASAHALAPCDRYAAPGGNDGGPGTAAAPYGTIQKLVSSLSPGRTGCARPGVFSENVTMNVGGTGGAPVTLRSENPDQRATLSGRLEIPAGVNNIVVQAMTLDGSTFTGIGIRVDAADVHFLGNEIRNDGLPCIFAAALADTPRLLIEGNRIHGCEAGVALELTRGARVVDNTIYSNRADRPGVLLYPDADGTVIEHNTFHGNGEGIRFAGDATRASDGNRFLRNVVSGSLNENFHSFFEGPIGTGNEAVENCVTTPQNGESASPGFTEANNMLVGDPEYGDAFALRAGSPCAGRGVLPGASTGGVTGLSDTGATLTGEVNPHFQAAEWFFQYGPGTSLTSSTPRTGIGPASVPVGVGAPIGVQPGATYSYRLVAVNPSGGTRTGDPRTFTAPGTPPAPDRDGDGVPDFRDACAGVHRGSVDANGDGCPDNRDGDAKLDADDSCPTLHAGRFDTNDNGCPGPMPMVRVTDVDPLIQRGEIAGRLVAVRLRNIELATEKGARVSVRCTRGCRLRGASRTRRAGRFRYTRGLPKVFKLSSVITFRVTKRGKAGQHFTMTFDRRRARVYRLRRKCIPIGSSKPAPLRACRERRS